MGTREKTQLKRKSFIKKFVLDLLDLLDDESVLVQAVYNCYSKMKLVNFYSLMNYIHLWNIQETKEKTIEIWI